MQLIDDVYTEPSEEDYEVLNYFYSKNLTYSTEDRKTYRRNSMRNIEMTGIQRVVLLMD